MNVFVRLIIWIKRLIKNCAQSFEVWDASAISAWWDKLQQKIESEEDVVILVPENVMKQLSDNAHKLDGVKQAYQYLMDCKSEKLKLTIIAENNRTLTNEEQILSVLEEYYYQGYNVTLVTCSSNMAFRAQLRDLNCLLYEDDGTNCTSND